mgnify:CR=1 FL=1
MVILWINLVVVYFVSLFSRYLVIPATIGPDPAYSKPNKFFALVVMIVFVTVAGLRSNIGDTVFYKHAYVLNTFTWEFIAADKDIGFGILQMILKSYSNNPQLLIFITAFITNLLILVVLYKYSRLFELSVYLYITSGLYIISMNGIRQFLAGAICFAATKYIFEGNWQKYILVVILASTFHQSALILIPIYFVIRRKAWTKVTFMLLFLTTFLVLGYNQLSEAFFSAIQDTQYSAYKEFNEGGANIIRVVIQAIPIILAYLGRDKLRELFPKIDYVVNMSLLGLMIMVIATQNWIFARFIIYFGLYNLILIPWVVKIFAKRYQRIVYYAILVFYLLYFYYESVVSLKIIYKSDYLKLFS